MDWSAVYSTVCAVPELALLLGVRCPWVLEHLTGRFNIQLIGSQTSYFTAENLAPPPDATTPLPTWLLHNPLPLPLEWSLHPPLHSPLSPLLPCSPLLRLCLSSEGADCQLCSSVCPSVLLLIAFDLNGLFFIWRLLPPLTPITPSTPHPTYPICGLEDWYCGDR